MAIEVIPRVRLDDTRVGGSPNRSARFPKEVAKSRITGRAVLSNTARRFRIWTARSASSKARRVRPRLGAGTGTSDAFARSVTEILSGKPDEHILQGDRTSRDAADFRVILVLLDQARRRLDRQDLA